MNPDRLFPYLVAGRPDAADLAVAVGHDVYAVVCEDADTAAGIMHAGATAAGLLAAGLTPADAHRVALENLAKFAEADSRLSIQVLGEPGAAVHFLLYSDHPRAAACLLLPDLYDEARDHLGTPDLCACVPQRESLVIFPDRGPAYRDSVVAKLREIEAGAAEPIGFGLFALTPTGVRPIAEG